jgi:RNA recognition motif-containing protein
MVKKLHIGNLAYTVSDDILKDTFSQFGNVQSATVVKDKISGRSKGFGFVEMSTDAEASEAMDKLNKSQFEGRTMFVSESRSTGAPSSGPRSGGGGGRSFGGGGGAGGFKRDRDTRRPR